MASGTKTPAKTLAAATQEDVLPLDRLVLLGTVTGKTRNRAMVRTASGRIQTLKQGATIGTAKVVSIDTGKIVIVRGSTTTTIRMPHS